MGASKLFVSDDRRAALAWKRGMLRDSFSLLVDGLVVEERTWWGTEFTKSDTQAAFVVLSGLGLRATVTMRRSGIWVEPTACFFEPIN